MVRHRHLVLDVVGRPHLALRIALAELDGYTTFCPIPLLLVTHIP